MKMRYAAIVAQSCVDGPGLRTTLFVQGCPIRCQGCQNVHLWPEQGGQEKPVTDLVAELVDTAARAQRYPNTLSISISGGEPFAQAKALAHMVACVKAYPAHIVLYTGYVLEDLLVMAEALPEIRQVLARIDVLVDGPYERRLDSPWMQYRGSSNQRVIDMRAWRGTLSSSVKWESTSGEIPELDWDVPELVIDPSGVVLGAEPVVALFAGAGEVEPSRRCGQTDGTRIHAVNA